MSCTSYSMRDAVVELLTIVGWDDMTDAELSEEARLGNGAAPIILRARSVLAAPTPSPVETRADGVRVKALETTQEHISRDIREGQEGKAEPVAYASAEQIAELVVDRPGDGGGVYLPLRKTPAGLFQMALYASQPDPAAEIAEERETSDRWRKLALQFDLHRIDALSMLRGVVAGTVSTTDVGAFLASRPRCAESELAVIREALEKDKARAAFLSQMQELAGWFQDGSETAIHLHPDDATRTWHVEAGRLKGSGLTIVSAVAAALANTAHRGQEEKGK